MSYFIEVCPWTKRTNSSSVKIRKKSFYDIVTSFFFAAGLYSPVTGRPLTTIIPRFPGLELLAFEVPALEVPALGVTLAAFLPFLLAGVAFLFGTGFFF